MVHSMPRQSRLFRNIKQGFVGTIGLIEWVSNNAGPGIQKWGGMLLLSETSNMWQTCDRHCSIHVEKCPRRKACKRHVIQLLFEAKHPCAHSTRACLYIYTACALLPVFHLLLTKAATESHHYFSGRNECAWVLNGTHLFPLRVLRRRC